MLKGLLENNSRPQSVTQFTDGTVVYFHLLTLKEHETLTSIKNSFQYDEDQFYEEIYNLCVRPEYRDLGGRIRAGIPRSIGEYIYFQSKNYDSIEEEIELARVRNDSNELYESMKYVILAAFPSYTIDNLDNLDRSSLIKLFVRAESMMVLKTQGNYKPVNTKSLRTQQKGSGIDFKEENKAITKAVGNGEGDDPWSRNHGAHDLLALRERAATRQQNRLERARGE